MKASGLQAIARRMAPFLLLAGLFVGALYLASSARLEPADYTFNNSTEVATLDPARVTGVPEGRIIKALFEGLVVKHPRTLKPMPGMAESWSVSEDLLTYTFYIRKDAKWTNGEPVTAHDFVYSWKRFLKAQTAAEYAYQLWYVQGAEAYTKENDENGEPLNSFDTVGIKANGDYILKVKLKSPTPFFMDLMAFYPMFPVNKTNIEEAMARWPDNNEWEMQWLRPENLVTNGPFTVEYRRVNDRIRLKKNPDYWDADNVAMNTIDALTIEQAGTALNTYLTGSTHMIPSVLPNLIPKLMPREDFEPVAYLGTYFYRVNTTKPPFDDVRVRKALAITVNRKDIVEKITKAGQVPAYGLVPPGMAGYVPAEFAALDPTAAKIKARELLAEAGYGSGGKPFPVMEVHYNTSEAHRDIAEVVAQTWRDQLGIDAKLQNQEWKVYLDTQNNLGFDVSRSAWIGDYPDPNTFLDMFVTGGENNKTGWGNAEYDRLITASASEADPTARLAILKDAEAILMDEMPIIPIYFYVTQNMVAPRLGGFYGNIQDEHFPKFLYWMNDEELAAKRADQPGAWEIVDDVGPSEGLYAPAWTGPVPSPSNN
ncbi:MAG: peptide ABC transporter substrate-binding protein [Planctomycetota bacterium]|nr:peptide ABC transporter substrate-binding protein [Planctomycetota bacterium]MDG2143524.1 peptide ABC transporter substrate-binding protein [Planctomycetota bacterium]